MIRDLKVLGLAVVAALAMSAMVASAAQAEGAKGTFTAGATTNTHKPVAIHGAQTGPEAANFFEAAGSKFTCENAGITFTSTDADGVATELTMTPTYQDCYAEKIGGLAMTVNMNGCDYTFTQPTTIAPLNTGRYTGKTDLTCEEGKAIAIEVFLFGTPTGSHSAKVCTMEIYADEDTETVGGKNYWSETLGGHVLYQNDINASNGKDDVTVTADISGITYKKSGTCGAAEGHNGIYKSTVTVTGKEDGTNNAIDVWVSDS